MKKTFIGILVVALCGLSYFLWHKASQADDAPAKPATAPAPAPEVLVTTLAEQRVSLTSELPGRTAVYQVAEIRPQVGGIIQKRPFTEGAEVKTGQLLYQIDPAPMKWLWHGHQQPWPSSRQSWSLPDSNLCVMLT